VTQIHSKTVAGGERAAALQEVNPLICLTRLSGKEFYLNPHLVEFMEETPNTVITLTTGKKIVVEEPAETVITEIVTYRRQIFSAIPEVRTCEKER
jgi:flagellar protein FlbD